MKAVKKPVVIEFVGPWDGTLKSFQEISSFMSGNPSPGILPGDFWYKDESKIYKGKFKIETLEGTMMASHGDYIIKGTSGEFYPIKPEIFKNTYDIIKEDYD